jgi:hypothetical protein
MAQAYRATTELIPEVQHLLKEDAAVHAMGPLVLMYVRPADDPRNGRASGDASY